VPALIDDPAPFCPKMTASGLIWNESLVPALLSKTRLLPVNSTTLPRVIRFVWLFAYSSALFSTAANSARVIC
jgi:hypothetical protein